MRTIRRTAVAAAAALTAIIGSSACSASSSGSPAAAGSAAAGGPARVATVVITADKGCTPNRSAFPAGPITFKVSNKDATAVSEVELLSGERIVGEKENLPPGFNGEFAVVLGAGAYSLYCPGAPTERTTVKITGKFTGTGDATLAALLRTATTSYAGYVDTQVSTLVAETAKLDAALHGTSLAAAQQAYMRARPYYERIEPVAESFVTGSDNLDSDIDVRIADTTFAQWRGFHRIEYGIFKQKSLAGMAAYGNKLVADVGRLKQKTAGLTYKPTDLANGAAGLLDEVSSSKITGEEERYSQIDLLDFAANDEGAEQAFAQLQPALAKIDATLAATVQTRFEALDKLVNTYRTDANASGFEYYTRLTTSDKQALAAAVKAVQEPLSTVASKVAGA